MREIVLDTETTGLNPNNGDRIVEIGCVELHRYMPTSKVFRRYVNPERDMPDEAFRVHGLSTAFLADKPAFAEIAGDLAAFLDGLMEMGKAARSLARVDAAKAMVEAIRSPVRRP